MLIMYFSIYPRVWSGDTLCNFICNVDRLVSLDITLVKYWRKLKPQLPQIIKWCYAVKTSISSCIYTFRSIAKYNFSYINISYNKWLKAISRRLSLLSMVINCERCLIFWVIFWCREIKSSRYQHSTVSMLFVWIQLVIDRHKECLNV